MFEEDIHNHHLEQLNQLRIYIDHLEFESRIIQKSEQIPINILLAAITVDYKERNRFINFSFVPISGEELDHINLLQFYTTLPIDLNNNARESLEKLIFVINTRMAIGHFGLQEDGEIYLRYIYTTHRVHGINEQQIVETMMLYTAMLDMHERLLDRVAIGEMSLQEALRELEE